VRLTLADAPEATLAGTVLSVGSYVQRQNGVVAFDTLTDTLSVGPKNEPSGDIIRAEKVEVPTAEGAVMTKEKVVLLPVATVDVTKTLDQPNVVPGDRSR
jgi:hypothetical protein